MDGSNVSQLDSAQIAGKIAKTQKLKNSEALYVNADNFELRLTRTLILKIAVRFAFSIMINGTSTARSCGFTPTAGNFS